MRILAIDDDPERYDYLNILLENRGIEVVVACCADCIARLLPDASAVLLDYDLDGAPSCTCGAPNGSYPRKSPGYIPIIALQGVVPVVVTSASSNENIRELCGGLRVYSVRFAQYRACDIDPEDNWIGKLWRMGVL